MGYNRGKLMKYRLQPLLIVTISLLILSLLLIQGIVLSYSMSRILSDNTYEMTVELLEQKNLRLNERIREIRDIALSIAINKEIQEILAEVDRKDYYQQIRGNKTVSIFLSAIANSRNDISQIFIVTDRMEVYNYAHANGLIEQSLVKDEAFFHATEANVEGILATSNFFIRNDSSDKYVATFFRKLQDSGNKELGTLCIILNDKVLRNLLQEETEYHSRRYSFIVTGDNRVISPFAENPAGINELLQKEEKFIEKKIGNQDRDSIRLNGNEYLIILTSPNSYNWRIAQLIPYSEINKEIGVVLRNIISIGLSCIFLTVIVLYYFSKGITRPLRNLIQQMGVVAAGTFNISMRREGIVEIEELNTCFANMTDRIHDLLEEINREHQKIRRAELAALQAQINPHFLYNTLDLINWMAIARNAHDISRTVSDLGRLFRLGLNKGLDITTVKNEIEHVRCYINIQRDLSGHEISFKEEYDPKIFGFQTIKLILQPLVENSCIHGFSEGRKNREVRIMGRIDEECIVFTISDNGSGVDFEYLNFQLRKQDRCENDGYGIRNVHDRIRMQFGDKYGIKYMPAQSGTFVEVRIPQISMEGQ